MDVDTSPDLRVGNANDASATRGWLVGSFFPSSAGPLHTDGVEVKWGTHRAGEERHAWTTSESRATLAVLVSGRFTIRTSDGDATLTRPGDYVAWAPGVLHWWRAEEDSVVVTTRWPAQPAWRKPCARWAPWRCCLHPTTTGAWVKRCVYCGREETGR
jgi:hypothetical protein